MPETVLQCLRELSAAKSRALSATLATACAALLHRYSCEGTLAIRLFPERSESWVELLPVELVVPRDAPSAPSFEQMLERARGILLNRRDVPEVEILMPLELQHEMRSQSIKVRFRQDSGRLKGTMESVPQTLGDDRAVKLAEHLQTLLRGIAVDPIVPISTLNMLGDQEAHKILIDWNQTDCAYPQGTVPELVERQAWKTPHAVALIQHEPQGNRELTYSQLDEQANRLANFLRKHGVGPEELVGLCMEQSLEAVVAVLGILKAGGAYVPLDPGFPQQRLHEISAESTLRVAVTSRRFRDRVPREIETICVDRDSGSIAAESSSAPATDSTPDSAAYVLYTSASTGKPKGVVGIHRSITNGLNSVHYRPDEVCCLNTFLSFGFSIANLFLPLMRGVPVVVLSDEQIRDSNQMMTVLESEGVTRLVLVPSVLQQILDPRFDAASRLRKITTIGVAGGRLTSAHFKRLREAMPQAALQNRYASTEIGSVAAVWNVDQESLAGDGEVPIGRPVANTRIYILDRYMNPVPAGVVGEICVGAEHLARGYLNRPDLTEERFIPDPFIEPAGAEPGRRLYRTGDLGRFRPNGELEFSGRIDHQVKVNGFRIDLPEVERALAGHIGVREVVAAVREIGNRQRLVAYVVVKPVGTPSASQLRKHLLGRLPDYMVPSRFMFLEAMPLAFNGKLDRNALPPPEPVRPELAVDYQRPGNPMEATIAQIWSDVLGLEPVGIYDDFRDLGGDSLSAAEVAVRLAEQFGIDVTPELLLDRHTIAALAIYFADAHLR